MSLGAVLTMLFFVSVLWGGFAVALAVAIRREGKKNVDDAVGGSHPHGR